MNPWFNNSGLRKKKKLAVFLFPSFINMEYKSTLLS